MISLCDSSVRAKSLESKPDTRDLSQNSFKRGRFLAVGSNHVRSMSSPHITRNFDFRREKSSSSLDGRSSTGFSKPLHNILEFDKSFEVYLKEIETITQRPLINGQIELIKSEIQHVEHTRLSTDESRINRKQFSKDKAQIIADWEKEASASLGKPVTWPKYDKPVYSQKGMIIRQVGDNYDVHEIILNSWGSPHQWWNAHPAKSPDEHQQGIHARGSTAFKIFGE